MATSTGVNVPTNTKIKEKDINAKLQLYGIYSAFSHGKVPSNKQVDVAMNTALEWGPLTQPSKNLSEEGRVLVADVRDVIEKAKIMLLTKNQGNLIQDFIWQTRDIGTNDVSKPNLPIEKESAKQQGQEALEGLRTLGTLMITNGQFRKLLNDAQIILRDIAGDAATKAAGKVKPTEDQLAQIDQPAEDNTWHEKPDVAGMKSNLQSKMPIGKKDAQAAAQDAADKADANAQGTGDPNEDAKKGGKVGVKNFKNNLSSRFDDDQKEALRKYRERTNNYFKEKVPKERRDQAILRLKKMIVEIQTHQDYQQAVETLLRLAEEYAGHTKNVAGQGQESAKGAHDQDALKTVETDLRELLERFANSTSFDDLFDSINQIYRDAEKDPELKQFFKDLDKYIRRCLQEQGYVIEDQSNEEGRRLYDQGQYLLRDKYKDHTNRILDEIKFLAGQFEEDPQNKAFATSMDKLFKDLGNDQDGKPTFKPHLVKDLTEVLLPAFFENIRYIPIPRIEFQDNMIDAVVENLVIEGDNLAPNVLEFGSDNFWRWGRKGAQSKNKNKVMLHASGVQMDLRDVAYYVKKKQGFPSITDKGVMDVFLGGSGLSFKVAMETADKSDKQHFFKINNVTVDIQNMSIKLKQSNHKLLFGLVKPLLMKVMKPVIQKVAEKQIRDQVTEMDAFLYRVKREADRAAEEAKNSPAEDAAPNFYNRIFNAYQKELQRGKEKKEAAKEKVADKKVNVAMTQGDSMFKQISLPGGISTKATEYKQLAEKGEKWESPVFSIGSAKETSNLPAPAAPKRKPHTTTEPKSVTDGINGTQSNLDSRQSNLDPGRQTNFDNPIGNTGAGGLQTATQDHPVTDGGIIIR